MNSFVSDPEVDVSGGEWAKNNYRYDKNKLFGEKEADSLRPEDGEYFIFSPFTYRGVINFSADSTQVKIEDGYLVIGGAFFITTNDDMKTIIECKREQTNFILDDSPKITWYDSEVSVVRFNSLNESGLFTKRLAVKIQNGVVTEINEPI